MSSIGSLDSSSLSKHHCAAKLRRLSFRPVQIRSSSPRQAFIPSEALHRSIANKESPLIPGLNQIVGEPSFARANTLRRRVRLTAFRPSHKNSKEAANNSEAGCAPEEGFDGAYPVIAQNDVMTGVHRMKPHEELDQAGCQHDQDKNDNLSLPGQPF